MNFSRVPVRISPDVLATIDAKVGSYGRPQFIRDAIDEKLRREAAPPSE